MSATGAHLPDALHVIPGVGPRALARHREQVLGNRVRRAPLPEVPIARTRLLGVVPADSASIASSARQILAGRSELRCDETDSSVSDSRCEPVSPALLRSEQAGDLAVVPKGQARLTEVES